MGAVLVALGVAGLWFLLDEDTQEQGSKKPIAPIHSVSAPARPIRAAPNRRVPSAPQVLPQKPPEGVLAVEVLSKNQPIPGAHIQVYEREPADLSVFPAHWFGRQNGETGADGQWEYPAAPGSYYVVARAEGLAPAYATVVHPPGSARTAVRLLLEEGVELVGSTLNKATDEPVSFAEILLTPPALPSGARGSMDAPEEESLVATTNAVGEFRFSALAPGRYRIEGRSPGYTSAVLPSVPVPFNGRVTLLMSPSGSLEGMVLGTNGEPATEAEVLAVGRARTLSAFSDSEGHFSLEVPPGAYYVSAHKGAEAGALEREVTVSVAQRVQGLRLQLGAVAWLSGKVVRRDGTRVLGARVEASPREMWAASHQTGTDESGTFSFPALAAGTYTLKVFLPEFFTFYDSHLSFSHGPVTLAVGEHVSLTLTQGGTPGRSLYCWAWDASGHAARDVQLRASLLSSHGSSTPQTFEGRTDARGECTFTGLPEGMYRVEALRDGRTLSIAESLFVNSQGDTYGSCYFPDLPSETDPESSLATVEGQVLQPSGGLPEGAVNLTLQAHAQPNPHRSRFRFRFQQSGIPVDAEGRFQFTVSPGKYTLQVFRQHAVGCEAAGQREFQLEAGQHLETTLPLEETREPDLRLRVLEMNGAPMRLSLVKVQFPRSSEGVLTDEQGRLDVCLPPVKEPPASGRFVVVTTFDGGKEAGVEAVRGLGEITVQLRRPPILQGRVIHPQGLPVRHVIVDISPVVWETLSPQEFVGDQFELPLHSLLPTEIRVDADGLKAALTVELQPEEHKSLEIPVYPDLGDIPIRRP